MLFRKNYNKPGPGISKDEPEKTGFDRLWQILQIEVGNLFKLNLLFILSCLPVVTIPPAIFAMNQVVRRMVKDQTVYCWHSYKTEFRTHWRKSYAAFFAVAALPLVGSAAAALFYLQYMEDNPLALMPFAVCGAILLTVLLSSAYLYGALGEGIGFRRSVRLALTLGTGLPFRAIWAALFGLGLPTVAILAFPISLPFLLLIGFSVPCLLANFFIRTIMRQYVEHLEA